MVYLSIYLSIYLPRVIELYESVSVLENDIPDPAVALEESLNVPLPALGGDVANKHP